MIYKMHLALYLGREVLSIADSGSPFGLYEKSYKLPAFKEGCL